MSWLGERGYGVVGVQGEASVVGGDSFNMEQAWLVQGVRFAT